MVNRWSVLQCGRREGCISPLNACIREGCISPLNKCIKEGCISPLNECIRERCISPLNECIRERCISPLNACIREGCISPLNKCIKEGCISPLNECIRERCISPLNKCMGDNIYTIISIYTYIYALLVVRKVLRVLVSGKWITKKHQKFHFIKCKSVTVILFGTMSKSFRKIVRIVFELRVLVWGWGWRWQRLVPKQAFSFYG